MKDKHSMTELQRKTNHSKESSTMLLTRLSLLMLAGVMMAFSTTAGAATPERAENFRLNCHQDRSWELYRQVNAPAVVLYTHATECGSVEATLPKLAELQQMFEPTGTVFMGINAWPTDERADVREQAEAHGLDFPILMDVTQRISLSLGLTETNRCLVVKPGDNWAVVYDGPVESDGVNFLFDALAESLAGDPVTKAHRPSAGTAYPMVELGDLSYVHDIAPILAEKCVTCHRPGGIGPFSLARHRRVEGWAPMMRETIRTKRMPPWHADAEFGDYKASLAMSVEEERKLLAWIEDGAVNDGDFDPLEAFDMVEDRFWVLGEPDHILEMPQEEHIPAEGVFEYRYIYIPTGLTEDKWLRAIEVQAGTPAVVHHALMFVIYPREYRHVQPSARLGLSGYFASFLPGADAIPYPEGTGKFLPAGSTIVFQMHYSATGRPEVDLTRMGLHFLDEPPARALTITGAHNNRFRVPPHAEDHPHRARYEFNDDVRLYGASPHMHFRGSRFRFDAHIPDGPVKTVLNVPFYEFDWQPMYHFAEPIDIPAGTRIECTGAFDNSALNPYNPDPANWVGFGEQSFQEMFIGYLMFSQPLESERYQPLDINTEEILGYGEPITEENLGGTAWSRGGFNFEFNEDGTLTVNGFIPGTWSIHGTQLRLEAPGSTFDLGIVGDRLFVRTDELRRTR